MAEQIKSVNHLPFLQEGGEMGERIRSYDWSTHPLGDPESWPQMLRLSVGLMLDNPFGMYIAWGKEYFQFYNDGYRPILGLTKHPQALGISTRETFAEIWHIIGDMFEGVMQGKAVRYKDFLLPLDRNGFIEDCYFDFSYSPIRLENGTVGGVLVTVVETTEKLKAVESLRQSESRFRQLANALPLVIWTANANGQLNFISNQWEEYYGNPLSESLGNGWIKFVHADDIKNAANAWKHSLSTGSVYEIEFRIQHKNGTYHWILVRALPNKNADGEIISWYGSNTDIQDKKISEDQAKESEARFKTMAEASDILISVANEELKTIFFNKAWEKLTGRPVADLVNFGWMDLLHPEDRAAFVETSLKALKNKESFIAQFRVLAKNGSYRWLLAKIPARFNADGSHAGYVSSSIDITERKQAEEKLQDSEQRLRIILESAPFPIGVYKGWEMMIEIANQSILDVWGKGQDVIGKSYKEILPELQNQDIFRQLENVFTTGIAFHAKNKPVKIEEYGVIKKYYFDYSFQPLTDSEGKIYGVINTAANVTDINLANLKVQESEKNIRNMVVQAPVAMCILRSLDFIVEIANIKMFELWGKPGKEVLNRPIFEALPEAREQGLEELLEKVYSTGESFEADELPVNLPRNGKIETVYVNFVYQALRKNDGKINGVLAVAIDVSALVLARRKIEYIVGDRTKELATANKDLQKSNAELAQFAYIASHDLQEPLRKISTFSQMLQSCMEGPLTENARHYLAKIDSASSRMNRLIRDVLTYSELVKAEQEFTGVNLNDVIANIQSDYDLLIEEKQATIIAETLPLLQAIPLQMFQLFSNLVGNSLKFAKKDQPPVITISATIVQANSVATIILDDNKQYHHIRFTDNGIGFKAEYAEQIFNIFQRLHRKSEYEGTGIGLAMCKKIIVNHRGAINAFGSSEAGAVFNIILPVQQ